MPTTSAAAGAALLLLVASLCPCRAHPAIHETTAAHGSSPGGPAAPGPGAKTSAAPRQGAGVAFPGGAVRFGGVGPAATDNAHLSVPPCTGAAAGTCGHVGVRRARAAAAGVSAEAWVRVHHHKTHNWVVGTDRRDAGWAGLV
jgi:hypothetical protein